MRTFAISLTAALALALPLTACGGDTTASSTSDTTTTTAPTTTDGSTTAASAAPYDIAGTWTDTDVVGANSCGLSQPAPGSSRVTPGIEIRQSGRRITLTAPPNIAGTRTVARGAMADDGTMTLTGSDGPAEVTLRLQAHGNDEISGTSRVVASGCAYNFTNTLTRSR